MTDINNNLEPEKVNKVTTESSNESLDNFKNQVSEKAIELKDDAKVVFDIAKNRINETLSDESLDKAADKLTDISEDAIEEIQKATIQTKNFLKKIFNK